MIKHNWRYYIIETFNGEVSGTNATAIAQQYAESEENYVIDSLTNQVLLFDGTVENIERIDTAIDES